MTITSRHWLPIAFVSALSAAPVRAAELNKYLPPETEIVVVVNVRAVVESSLVQKQVPLLVKQYGESLLAMSELGGLKFDENLRKMLVKSLGDTEATRKWLNDHTEVIRRIVIGSVDFDKANTLLILEGDFNKEKLKELFAFLAAHKPWGVVYKPITDGKYDFYSLTVPGEDDELYVALADQKNILCCQDKKELLRALERVGHDKQLVRKQLSAAADRIDQRACIWMAAATDKPTTYLTAHGVILLTDGIKLAASITSTDADEAKTFAGNLTDEIKDKVEELDDAAKQSPLLAALRDILKKVEPRANKNVVSLEIEVQGPVLDKIFKDLPGAR